MTILNNDVVTFFDGAFGKSALAPLQWEGRAGPVLAASRITFQSVQRIVDKYLYRV